MSRDGWPGIGFEERRWTPSRQASWGVDGALGARSSMYRATVAPLIRDRAPVLAAPIQQLAEQAAQELRRFDAELGQRVSLLRPGAAALRGGLLLADREPDSLGPRDLQRGAGCEAQPQRRGDRREHQGAARRTDTLREADRADHPADARRADGVPPRHPPRGRWRDEPVWIGTRSDSPIGATYVAPDHGSIPELMEDLVRFIARTDLPPLVRTALAQAQFDTIHPFTDGNGLTGRALAQAMPRHRDVTRNVAAPVSAGLLADVEGYHAAVDVYRAGDLDPIVGQFNLAAPRAVANGRRLVEEIDDTRARWDERLTPRKNSNAWRLLDVLPRRPVLTSTTAAEELGVRQPDGIRRCAR